MSGLTRQLMAWRWAAATGFVVAILSAPGARAEEAAYEEGCFECHGSAESLEESMGKKVAEHFVVPAGALKGTIHEELECSECHVKPSEEADEHYEGGPALKLNCAECHEEQTEQYLKHDIHGKEFQNGNEMAPWCSDCHGGGHNMAPLSSDKSVLAPINQPEMCGRCHGGIDFEHQPGIAKRKLVDRYYTGVHWQKIQEGIHSASCTDCHGSHTILPSSDEHSSVSRTGLLATCAKCHADTVQGYTTGSHGQTLLHGNLDVPTCTTCHGDHDMISLRAQPGGKRDFAATQVCMWCHGNERMMARYALDTSPVESYLKDFHGLSQRGSFGASATCADCHDPHRSLPSSHPKSRMHITNRGAACGKCHGDNTSESFIMSFSHKSRDPGEMRGKVKRVITWVYVILIVVVIGGMALHNLMVWLYYARLKRRYQDRHGAIMRMTAFERGWHWALFISFSLLALTGFALSFSTNPLLSWLYHIGITEQMRGWLHRVNAIVLCVDMTVFLVYKTVSRRGRMWWTEMWPRWRDVKDLWGTVLFYMGFRSEKPRYGVFNYGEKAEYWALWWGTVIMAVTGVMLWFSKLLPPDAPAWLFEAARTVHFWEAVLATAAIVVWHFFNTIFHPAEYPMDTCWMTGRLTEEEAHHRFDDKAVEAQRMPPQEHVPAPETHAWMKHDDDGEKK